MKKLAIGLFLLVAAGVSMYHFFGERLVTMIAVKVATATMRGDTLESMPDGLHVMLCGAGSPLQDQRRSGPCVLVIAGKRVFVVDAGSGASGNITPSGIPIGKVERVFLTHFHSDHIDGLGELATLNWAASGRGQPLPVHGPDGVQSVIAGFNTAYSHDFGYRVAHHGAEIVRPDGAGMRALPFRAPVDGQEAVLLEEGKLRVIAFRVGHDPIRPAVGYRFDYAGRSLVISGDTVKSANLQHFARDTDLLVHEALAPQLVTGVMREGAQAAGRANLVKIFDDILNYHTTPMEAAEIARDARVRHLLLYHIVPGMPARPLEKVFLRGVSDTWDGPVTLGEDGTWIGLPAGSDAILEGNLLPITYR